MDTEEEKPRDRVKKPSQTEGRGIGVVYPYVLKEARNQEPLYSIRSIYKNFKEEFFITIVGDDPGWLSDKVSFINCTKKTDNPPLDVVNKMKKVIGNKAITEDFIWMDDDIYFLTPVMNADIAFLKSIENLDTVSRNESNLFRRNLWATYDLLKKNGLPVWNYSTHLPVIFNKKKLIELITKFHMDETAYAVRTLYFNYYYPEFIPFTLNVAHDNLKVGAYRDSFNYQKMKHFFNTKRFFNHSDVGYSKLTEKILSETFPERCPAEKEIFDAE